VELDGVGWTTEVVAGPTADVFDAAARNLTSSVVSRRIDGYP
jgi:hypothetical protein